MAIQRPTTQKDDNVLPSSQILAYIDKQIQRKLTLLENEVADLRKQLEEAKSVTEQDAKKTHQDKYSFNPIAKFKFLLSINDSTLSQLNNKPHSELYRIFSAVVITQSVDNYNDYTNTSALNEHLIKNTLKLFEAMKVQLSVDEEIEICQFCSQFAKQIQNEANAIELPTPSFNQFTEILEKNLMNKPTVDVKNIKNYTSSTKFPNQYKFSLNHAELYNSQSNRQKKSYSK